MFAFIHLQAVALYKRAYESNACATNRILEGQKFSSSSAQSVDRVSSCGAKGRKAMRATKPYERIISPVRALRGSEENYLSARTLNREPNFSLPVMGMCAPRIAI